MASVSSIIRDYLLADPNPITTFEIAIAKLSDSLFTGLVITEYQVESSPRNAIERVDIQLVSRDLTYEKSYEIQRICQLKMEGANQFKPNVDTTVIGIMLKSGPFFLTYEQRETALFSSNYKVILQRKNESAGTRLVLGEL